MFSKKVAIQETPCAELSQRIKKLNGKSAERLRKSILALAEALKEEETCAEDKEESPDEEAGADGDE